MMVLSDDPKRNGRSIEGETHGMSDNQKIM